MGWHCALFHTPVNLPLKYLLTPLYHIEEQGFRNMTNSSARAMGVMDLPVSLYSYSAPVLEEIVSKIEGVKSVRINNISRKVTVEFDPSVTSFARIRDTIKQAA